MLTIPIPIPVNASPELAIPTVVFGKQSPDVTAVSLGGVKGTVDSVHREKRQLGEQADANGTTRQRVMARVRKLETIL